MAYECDICGKEFTNTFGAYIGVARPPFYDRMVYCKDCREYVRQQKEKNTRKKCKRFNGKEVTTDEDNERNSFNAR